jgi:hypothetical protein
LIVQTREILGRSNRDGHELLWTDEACLDISVSKAALPRALRLAAGLITALEEEGNPARCYGQKPAGSVAVTA